jgi:rare lipoprotein A
MKKMMLLFFLSLSLKMVAQKEAYASIYSKSLCGDKTANGKNLDCEALTAAHRTLPFGSKVRVTNIKTGNSVIVTITDRGPFSHKLTIDLTPRAANAIDLSYKKGIMKVKIEPLTGF